MVISTLIIASKLITKISVVMTILMTFALNVPKYKTMYDCYVRNNLYTIFPDSKKPVLSESDALWLIIHLTSGLSLMSITAIRILLDNYYDYFNLHKNLHYWNCVVIIINAYNFNRWSVPKALCVNLGATIGLILLEHYKHTVAYFFLLSVPVILQTIDKYILDK